ncbi:hypothetical protein CDV55_108734 [Aspergillus turcosus]|nr:hypothetical protein CDV55_108734 [Aspergillus turcosus]
MQSIKVFIRWRPLSPSESNTPEISRTQHPHPTNNTLALSLTPPPSHKLSRPWKSDAAFTRIFTAKDNNKAVFEAVVAPTLPRVLNGQSCNFFAYGHTGTGKSHTIIGYEFEHPDELRLCLFATRAPYKHIDQLNASPNENEKFLLELHLLNDRCNAISAKDTTAKRTSAARQKPSPMEKSACDRSSQRQFPMHAVFEIEIVSRGLLDARDAVVERQSELVPVGKRATDIYLEENMKAFIQTPHGEFAPNPDYQINQQAIDEAEVKKAEFESFVRKAEEHVLEVK